MFHQLKVCLILVKNALHLFHLQARKFSMQILFREHDVTGEIIFIIKLIWKKSYFGLRICFKFGVQR